MKKDFRSETRQDLTNWHQLTARFRARSPDADPILNDWQKPMAIKLSDEASEHIDHLPRPEAQTSWSSAACDYIVDSVHSTPFWAKFFLVLAIVNRTAKPSIGYPWMTIDMWCVSQCVSIPFSIYSLVFCVIWTQIRSPKTTIWRVGLGFRANL